MSIIQSTQSELRYIKRQNLDHEARIVGNYYRDLIRSYGIDCIYHKLNTSEFSNFKDIIDRNTILKHAYGYDFEPDYSLSSHTLTYMEIENDIFQLNKFGLNPNMDVNFYFENNDFACALATKLGQYKEYPIKEIEIQCEVPECTNEYDEFIDESNTNKIIRHYLSSNVFPYNLGLGYNEYYYAENLSGKLNVEINGYEVGKETTVICNPYEHTDFNVEFNSNTDLYRSIKHKIENDSYLETMIYLTFVVNKVIAGKQQAKLQNIIFNGLSTFIQIKNVIRKLYNYLHLSDNLKINNVNFDKITNFKQFNDIIANFKNVLNIIDTTTNYEDITNIIKILKKLYTEAKKLKIYKNKYKYILSGKIYGNILFFDINQLGKYAEKIHPSAGDIVIIDFPDENNREKYEITDCYDKQLTQDGISPLLHKYIWKCKARRFVDSYNEIEQSEADERLQEKKEYEQVINEEITKQISVYDDNQDAAYGGYELDHNTIKNYDKQDTRNIEHVKYEGIPEGQLIDIHHFGSGSKLCTDGYNLIFMTNANEFYVITTIDHKLSVRDAVFECGIKWLKATKNAIYFTNIEGQTTLLATNANNITSINLENIYTTTIDTVSTNKKLDSFIKFNSCKSYLFATNDKLFAKFENDNSSYQII